MRFCTEIAVSFHRYSAGDGQTSVSFCLGRVGDLKAGDVAVLSGHMERESYGNHPIALVTGRKILGHVRPLPPVPITSRQLRSAALEHRPVQVSGELIDVVRDDIDYENMFLVLQDVDGRLVVACALQEPDRFQKLVIFLWNRLLQRLIRRRSGELARMELAKATSDLLNI